MKKYFLVLMFCLLFSAVANAQTATPLHRWAWDQSGDTTGLTFEVSVDNQAHAPVLGTNCVSGVCRGDLPLSLSAGSHTARMRAVRVVDGVRLVSADSNLLTFTYVTAPEAPGNLRLQPPQGITVSGQIQQRYPFANLDVASTWLDQGDWLYIGAQRLSVPEYSVQAGDTLILSLLRRAQ